MKKHLFAITAVAVAIVAVISCGKDPQDKPAGETVLTVDREVIDNVDAQTPAEEAVMITSNTSWIVFAPNWVTPDKANGNGNDVVTFRIQPNYKENSNTEPREGEVTIEGGQKSVKILISQNGYTKPIDPNASIGGISDKVELMRFVKAVNEGTETLDRWRDEEGFVALLADIDLTGETWTPIGCGTFTTGNAVTIAEGENCFSDKFDGKGHKITGLSITVPADAVSGATFGFFGTIVGGTVKDLIIDNSMIVSHATALAGVGAVAGYVQGGTITNCESYAELSFDGGSDGVRYAMGGVLGEVGPSTSAGSTISGCKNHGKVSSVNTTNTKNGATGFSIGGVIGLAEGAAGFVTKVTKCENHGTVEGGATRMAGVVATLNTYADMEECLNEGAVNCNDTKASNSRAAGITAAMGNTTNLINCVNRGNISFVVDESAASTFHGYVAGIVGQINNAADVVDGCENYGTIRSDMWYCPTVNADTSLADKFMGIITASCNSYACTIKNCKVGGKIGPYTNESEVVTLTAANFRDYLTMNFYRARNAIIEDTNVFAGN